MEIPREKWSSKIAVCEIGAAAEKGGTRAGTVKIGGHGTLPFLDFENEAVEVHKPAMALEIFDVYPENWPEVLIQAWGGKETLSDPVKWVKQAEEFGPELLCVRLVSPDPDGHNSGASAASAFIREILKNTRLPLIITGCGNNQKDMEIMPEVIEVLKGENALVGIAVKENFKTLAACCISSGCSLIAESPIDINLAKQLNILLTDMRLPIEKIVMHHSTGALGYGIEYTYSVMERVRLAALSGDKMMSAPMINFVGQEVWKSKEAKATYEEMPKWGEQAKRAVDMEVVTGITYLQAGSDILVLNHPEALKIIQRKINELVRDI